MSYDDEDYDSEHLPGCCCPKCDVIDYSRRPPSTWLFNNAKDTKPVVVVKKTNPMKITIRKTTIEEVVLNIDFGHDVSIQHAMEVAEGYQNGNETDEDVCTKTEGKWVAVAVNTKE